MSTAPGFDPETHFRSVNSAPATLRLQFAARLKRSDAECEASCRFATQPCRLSHPRTLRDFHLFRGSSLLFFAFGCGSAALGPSAKSVVVLKPLIGTE